MSAAKQLDLFGEIQALVLREVGPQIVQRVEAQLRDATLERHESSHAQAIAAATDAALALYARNGRVTAPEIPDEMRRRGDGWLLAGDTRWMGAVLLPSKGWVSTGQYVRTGSKGRPVPVWIRNGGVR